MSDYRKTNVPELDSLMDTIYSCQRGVHNYEEWGEFDEFENIDHATHVLSKRIKELEEIEFMYKDLRK